MGVIERNKEKAHRSKLLDFGYPSTSSSSLSSPSASLVAKWYDNLFAGLVPPSESEADKAFKEGTELITDLLLEGTIDSETAKSVLSPFVELYANYKVECTIRKFLERRGENPLLGALGSWLEEE